MPEKIGVLFIQSQSGFGADSLIHSHLMRHLDRNAFTVHVACTAGEGSGKPDSLAILEKIPDLRVRHTRFAPGFRGRDAATLIKGIASGLAFPVDFGGLCRYVVREGIRIVHGSERPRDSAYAVALAAATRSRSVVHVHVKWSNEYSRPARLAVRHADAALGVSKYVTETIVQMGRPRERTYTLENAIEFSRWDPASDGSRVRREFSIAPSSLLLVSVSRLFSWKGQRELVRALALVEKEIPDVRLMIVGGDEQYVHGGSFTQELKALARELGVLERVSFTGQRSDIPEIMAAADLFTMPSFEEPFGLVFLEAMAMKKPVIAIDNGGTPEVVEHGSTGLLSPPWDVPALAANILALAKDPDLRRRMGEAGRERVRAFFTTERMAQGAADIYRRIL